MGTTGSSTSYGRKWQFRTIEELVEYVANTFDIEPESERVIRGTGLDVRRHRDVETDQDSPRRFHNPVFNHITSPHGELVIGAQSFNIRALPPLGLPGTVALPDNNTIATALTCYQDFTGLEICQSEDGREITYSDGNASMRFKAFRGGTWPTSEIGTRITTWGSKFERAIINSRYYGEAYQQTCDIYKYGSDSDANDDYLDEYEWGLFGISVSRVESLCRAQWRDRRLSGVVSHGEQCYVVGTVQPWPEGYPEDWPPITPEPVGSVQIRPTFLEFRARTSRPVITKGFSVTNATTDPVVVTVDPVQVLDTMVSGEGSPLDPTLPSLGGTSVGTFSNTTGQLTLQPSDSITFDVTFTSEGGFGSVTGRIRVTYQTEEVGNRVDIDLLGTFAQEAIL